MAENVIKDMTKKSFVVTKNEIKKYLRGKKILIISGIIILVLALTTILPYAIGDGLSDQPLVLAHDYMMLMDFIIAVIAILFAATTIVSEFEERTALITFTKPIRRSSIFLGKFVATSLIGALFVIIYFMAVALISLCVTGEIASELFTSMGLALLYMMGVTGVALLLSSVMKKSSNATLIAFVVLIVILPIITHSIVAALGDVIMVGEQITGIDYGSVWWMLDVAGYDIGGVLEGADVNVLTSAGVMVAWCTIATILSYILFRRRDF